MNLHCPCGSNSSYDQCCGRFIESGEWPETCEQLMRSRYTAFVLENARYLSETWAPEFRPEQLDFEPGCKWLGLKILSTKEGQKTDTHGVVTFVARYKIAGKATRLEEVSQFRRVEGRWLYEHALEN